MPGSPPPIPPITEPIFSLLTSRTLVAAALIAAVMRSSSMPTSLGSTTDLSILTRTTSNWPFTVAVTRPPPEAPSQVILASSSWARWTSPWSFWACFISALRSGIFPLDIGLDLLDLGAKRLQHVLGDRMLAGLGLALGSLRRRPLPGGLEDRARRALGRLAGVEHAEGDPQALERRAQGADDRADLVGAVARHLAHVVGVDRVAELEQLGGPGHHARLLEQPQQRELAKRLELGEHGVPRPQRLGGVARHREPACRARGIARARRRRRRRTRARTD